VGTKLRARTISATAPPNSSHERLATARRGDGLRMHSVLASDPNDPALAPEDAHRRSAPLLTADDRRGESRTSFRWRARGRRTASSPKSRQREEVRSTCACPPRTLAKKTAGPMTIPPPHGTFNHLGSEPVGGDRLGSGKSTSRRAGALVSFNGRPAPQSRSPLPRRRRMLRSFAYAAHGLRELLRDTPSPDRGRSTPASIPSRGYFSTGPISEALLPSVRRRYDRLLASSSSRRAVYEPALRSRHTNLPRLGGIPVARDSAPQIRAPPTARARAQ